MGWFIEHMAAKLESESIHCDKLSLDRRNLVTALQLGMIDWFQYLEACRKLNEPSVANEVARVFALKNKKAA